MKKSFLLFTYMTFMCAGPTYAQWIAQANGQFNSLDWVNLLRIADTDHIWAGVSSLNGFGGVAGVSPRIVHTSDAGQTWQTLTIAGTDGYDVWGMSLLGPDTIFASLNRPQSTEDRLYRSTDGGQSWTMVVEGAFAGKNVYFRDALHGLLFRGPYNTRFTTDGGQTWLVPPAMPAGLANQSIFNYPGSETEVVGNRFWVGLEDGRLLRTDDAGQTWQAYDSPVNTPISDLAFEDEQTGLAAAVFQVNNGGSWTSGLPSRLFRTVDGGQNWTEIPKAQLPFDTSGAFISVMEATGTPGEYVMEARNFTVPGLDYQTFRSTDGGQSWQEISNCPVETLGVIEFNGPGIGYGGTALLQNLQGSLFFKWGIPGPSKVILQVDMGDTPVSPQGLHLSCNYNQWNPSATPMMHIGGTLWSVGVEVPADSILYYRFVNGVDNADAETVPERCGVANPTGFVREARQGPCGDTQVPEVLFGHCLPNGELAPQNNTVCDTGGAYLICENFDNYLAGKVGPQSEIWRSYGCAGDEGDACDVDLDGYQNGFTNYSGQWAMHPNGINSPGGQSIDLLLGEPISGKYELSFRFYLPRNNQAYMGLYFDFTSTYSSIDLTINSNGVLSYDKYDGETFEYGADTSFQISNDAWHDIRFEFDLDVGKRSMWWDGGLVHSTADPQANRLVSMSFSGSAQGAYFIDDVTLKDLLYVSTTQPDDTPPAFSISPNPVSGSADIRYSSASNVQVALIDPLGRVAFQTVLPPARSSSKILPLEAFEGGVYQVVMRNAGGTLSRMLVVSR